MRDEETAQIAVRASITGHLVLSTIHTNNALATIERLIDMGVERYMLATSVTGIISQKLARTLCDKCKKKRPVTKYERHMFAQVLHKKVEEVYEPVGCSECHQGFTGRIALHEVLYISEHLRDMIADSTIDKDELRQAVYAKGETTTLLQDALQKVVEGYTTFQEIYRVVDVDVDLDNSVKAAMDSDEDIELEEFVEEEEELAKPKPKKKKTTDKNNMVEYDFINVPIVDIVNQIILYASQHRVSDIHFDPLEDSLMVRMRIDGDLQNHSQVPKVYEKNLVTRIKLVAAMNITETRLPQDGAIKARIGGRDLDMRVSVLPTNEGEKCVVRILDFQKGLSGLDGLGFTESNFSKIEKMLAVPSGIILVTGATGSGKSTTTYSMLESLNNEETNIITVEDPIEMNIEGINQVQINSEIGMTFAAALRSILRQDPNVILIGEMRDEETAQIAVRASITGHLVLSTIHTNSALATIERLIDMGVERYMLATSVAGIISQKLSRTLCDKCKKKRPVTKYERHMFAKVLGKKIKEVYEPVGCSECHQGFTGRIALHEVLYISEHLRDMIADESLDKDELRRAVYSSGETTTLLQDALQKVVDGKTTFQEIYRVVDVDVDLENSIRDEIGLSASDDIYSVAWDENDDDIDLATIDEGVKLIVKKKTKKTDDDKKKKRTKIVEIDEDAIEIQEETVDDEEVVDNKKDSPAIMDEFIASLAPSDPAFVNFLMVEDDKIKEDYAKIDAERELLFQEFLKDYSEKYNIEMRNALFQTFLRQYDEKLTREKNNELFKAFLFNYDRKLHYDKWNKFEESLRDELAPIFEAYDNCTLFDEVEEEEVIDAYADDDNLTLVLEERNTLDNVIAGFDNKAVNVNDNLLDLSSTEFNYKEVLDIIDAYADIGPSIQDVVDDDIRLDEKINNYYEDSEYDYDYEYDDEYEYDDDYDEEEDYEYDDDVIDYNDSY